jgi:hypothetical protein
MSAAASAVATFSDDEGALGFYTMTSCRVLDTLYGTGVFGGPAVSASETRVVQVAGVCGIPPTARAVAVTLHVTKPTRGGNLRLYPADVPMPLATAINYAVGQTRSNFAITGLSATGAVAIRPIQAYNSGTVHVILDVTGYFE